MAALGLGALCAALPALAQAQAEPDLFDYTPPQVLSVTRMAQSLADVPGAVTVLDRQTLRRSGARTVTEDTRVLSPSWRWVLGGGVRDESIGSSPLFTTTQRVGVRDWRVFGHAEWAPAPGWLVNASLCAGDRSDTGSYLAPRLMLNHEIAPGHTLRAGLTRAERPPLLFERSANARVNRPDGRVHTAYLPNLQVRNEVLHTQELGYHASLAQGRVNLDVRLYEERLHDFIQFSTRFREPDGPYEVTDVNAPGFTLRGLEHQLIWRPSERTEWRLNQSFNQVQWQQPEAIGHSPPLRMSTVM